MPVNNDQTYGQAALGLGFVTEAQIQECVRIQSSMRQMGIDEPLGEIMVKKGFLTPQQQSGVLKKLGVQTSPIPGYSILSKIGQGGMGVVYKATQTSVNRTVAIKILSGNATKDKTYVARFLQEAQSAANLNHKNLISAIDVGVSNGIYYFVMEFVTGKSCRDLMNVNKGPLAENTALQVAMQMAEVLEHIHQHKMVHRDIKPENILLTPEGVVKLCDLGLAKSTAPIEQSLTQEGLAVGTPYFMSPEQIRGDKDVDIRADLYSLGATLFFLLTGKHPYEGKSAAETMSMHLKEAVPDPRKLAPQMREDFSWVIQKLMAKERSHRYQTPSELLDDLRKIQAGSAPAHARQHAARVHLHQKAHPVTRHVVRKTTPVWPLVAGGGVLVAGVVAVVLLKGGQAPAEQPKEKIVYRDVEKPVAAPKAEGPKDDPKKAGDASLLYNTAELCLKQEKWKEALANYQKLLKAYESLQFTQQRAVEVGAKIATCQEKIRDAETTTARKVEEARQALREGRWAEASAALQELVKSGHLEFHDELDRCRREIEATVAIREIEAARDAGRWVEVAAKTMVLLRQNEPTKLETVEKHQGELLALVVKAKSENEATKALSDAFASAQAGYWREVQRLLVELEKHRETDIYHQKEAEIRDLRTRYAQANEAAADEEATRAWSATLKLYTDTLNEKKYDDAAEALQDYQQRHGASRVGKSKETEINAKLADVTKRKAKDKDDDARRLLAQARKEVNAGNYELGGDLVGRLLGELADTPYVKSNESTIKGLKKLCDDRARQPAHIIIELDFEDYPGTWRFLNGATGGNAFEEPQQGRRSARLTLPNNSRASHPLSGMTSKAEIMTFWARSRGKSSANQLEIYLHDDSGSSNYTYMQEVTLTSEWKPYTLPLALFKPVSEPAKKNPMVPARVTSFTLESSGAPNQILELQLDTLRIEAARPVQK